MVLSEFLEFISKHKSEFYIIDTNIRSRLNQEYPYSGDCPICFTCNKIKNTTYTSNKYLQAAHKINLKSYTARRIADACDSRYGEPNLRARILKALDLKEQNV